MTSDRHSLKHPISWVGVILLLILVGCDTGGATVGDELEGVWTAEIPNPNIGRSSRMSVRIDHAKSGRLRGDATLPWGDPFGNVMEGRYAADSIHIKIYENDDGTQYFHFIEGRLRPGNTEFIAQLYERRWITGDDLLYAEDVLFQKER